MDRELEIFEQKLDNLIKETDELLQELARLRRNNPAAKAQSAKILENHLIQLSGRIKQICKANNDDITAGISFLKIKMFG